MEIATLRQALEAAESNGWLLQEIPEAFRTKEVCATAVAGWPNGAGQALEWVPEELVTEALCRSAVINADLECECPCLQYVPKRFRTKAVCEAAVAADGMCLEFVPEELKTPEMCADAVRTCGGAVLPFVPDGMLPDEPDAAGPSPSA